MYVYLYIHEKQNKLGFSITQPYEAPVRSLSVRLSGADLHLAARMLKCENVASAFVYLGKFLTPHTLA